LGENIALQLSYETTYLLGCGPGISIQKKIVSARFYLNQAVLNTRLDRFGDVLEGRRVGGTRCTSGEPLEHVAVLQPAAGELCQQGCDAKPGPAGHAARGEDAPRGAVAGEGPPGHRRATRIHRVQCFRRGRVSQSVLTGARRGRARAVQSRPRRLCQLFGFSSWVKAPSFDTYAQEKTF